MALNSAVSTLLAHDCIYLSAESTPRNNVVVLIRRFTYRNPGSTRRNPGSTRRNPGCEVIRGGSQQMEYESLWARALDTVCVGNTICNGISASLGVDNIGWRLIPSLINIPEPTAAAFCIDDHSHASNIVSMTAGDVCDGLLPLSLARGGGTFRSGSLERTPASWSGCQRRRRCLCVWTSPRRISITARGTITLRFSPYLG